MTAFRTLRPFPPVLDRLFRVTLLRQNGHFNFLDVINEHICLHLKIVTHFWNDERST